MTLTNTYKQVKNQLSNNWLQDAYICKATCELKG